MKYNPTDLIEIFVWIDDDFFIKKKVFGSEVYTQQTLILEEGALVQDDHQDTWYPPHRISKVTLRKANNEDTKED